jgi:hypothetical protein
MISHTRMLFRRWASFITTLLLVLTVVACDSDRVRREAADSADAQSVMEGSIAKSSTKKAARWKEVLAVKNKKNAKTKTFRISGNEWKIRWKTKPKRGQEGEEFLVVLYDKKNKDVNEIIANDMGQVEDFLYLDGKGDYFLEITTNLAYELVVEERKSATVSSSSDGAN